MAVEKDFSAVYRPRKAYETEPFDSSAVDFTKFTEMVTRILSIFNQGLVVAIDGPWGHGKSFFGTNFAAQLKKAGLELPRFRGRFCAWVTSGYPQARARAPDTPPSVRACG